MAHPLRLQILSLLTGAEMSAAEVARELDTSQANASYHLRVLAAAGHVVDAGEEKIRGGVAKRYRHPWNDDSIRDEATPAAVEDSRMFVEAICTELVRRQAYAGGGPGCTVDAEMWVTPEVWGQVLDLTREASALIHDRARPPRTEGAIHVNLTTVAFTMMREPRTASAKVGFVPPPTRGGDTPASPQRKGTAGTGGEQQGPEGKDGKETRERSEGRWCR